MSVHRALGEPSENCEIQHEDESPEKWFINCRKDDDGDIHLSSSGWYEPNMCRMVCVCVCVCRVDIILGLCIQCGTI